MRFRKSVKICPGVKVNFSKSGVSTTFGGKGASVSVGKNGTYLNTGIPGTGLYDRTKIGGSSSSKRRTSGGSTRQSATSGLIQNLGTVTFDYLEDGSFEFFNDGVGIADKATINAIKNADMNFKVIEPFE